MRIFFVFPVTLYTILLVQVSFLCTGYRLYCIRNHTEGAGKIYNNHYNYNNAFAIFKPYMERTMKLLVPFAEGFEEIEGVTIVDVLRRADISITTVHLGKNPVTGSHGIAVTADCFIEDVDANDFDGIVLPGGMPGSENLRNSSAVLSIIRRIHDGSGYIGALCAAPLVLGHAGILTGKRATCYPGFEDELRGAEITGDPITVDGNIITGRGPGCAITFALEITGIMKGNDVKMSLKETMQVYWDL